MEASTRRCAPKTAVAAPPRRLHRLIGRDDELARLRTALASHRPASLVGPGGIGKASLALAAARERAPTTGWLVELATITSPADVPEPSPRPSA